MIEYLCSCCGVLTTDPNADSIDSGTTLTCSEPHCQADTVVDLNTPAARSRAFALAKKAPIDAESIQALLEEWSSLLNHSDFIRIGRTTAIVSQLGSITRRGFKRTTSFINARREEGSHGGRTDS